MKILLPKTILALMIGAGTSIAEPADGESEWASGGDYAEGVRKIRTQTHRVYECVQAATGRTVAPEDDGAYWLDVGPTQRWAPFDHYVSTAAAGIGSITYVLKPGFINALGLWGINGTQLVVTLKDAPGGTVLYTKTIRLSEPSAGWYDYLFGVRKPITQLVLSGLPIRPAAELTITISAAAGVPVGIGMIVVGDYRSLVGERAEWGGTEAGATAEPVTYSYIKTEDDGTVKIVRRHAATSIRASVILPRSEADAALALMQSVLDVPVGYVATDAPGFDGLKAFGLGVASLSYHSKTHATMDLTVKGMI